jgi:hypothetical protein
MACCFIAAVEWFREKACREVEGFSQPRQRRLTVQPRRASALIDQNQPAAIFEVRTRAMFHSLGRSLPLHRPASLEARGKWAMVDTRVELQTCRSMACRIGRRPAPICFFGRAAAAGTASCSTARLIRRPSTNGDVLNIGGDETRSIRSQHQLRL